MLHYFPIILTFIILINSFAIGKIIKKNFFTLSSSLSFFSGLIVYCVIYSMVYVPFILISDLKEYYIYTLLAIQAILLIFYFFNWKSFSITLVFNYKILLSSLISLSILFVCFYLFFIKVDFTKNTLFSYTDIWSNQGFGFKSFSIINSQLVELFSKVKISNSGFVLFQNVLVPIIIILFANSAIVEFYAIQNFKNVKKFITLIFISFLLGFFIFNINKTALEPNDLNENLLNDRFAIIVFFYAVNVFVKNNTSSENQVYFFILNYSLIFLVFHSSNFIIISLLLFLMVVIYVSFKQINFGADLILENSIFVIASICVFTLSKYYLTDTASIIIFSLMLAASIILFSIFYILKRNNYKTTYWPFIQKATFKIHKYFKVFYFFLFLVILIAVIVNSVSKLFVKDGLNNFINNINVFNIFINLINYNASNKAINFTNSIFIAFYLMLLIISFVYVWIKRKEKNNFNNFLLFSFTFLLLFNPLVIYEIKNLSYILSITENSSNFTYDFSLFAKFILIFPFVCMSFLFQNIQFVKLNFKFMENMNVLLNTENMPKKYFNNLVFNVKKTLYISSNILSQVIQNDYFKFGLYGSLMCFFTISVFVCNFI